MNFQFVAKHKDGTIRTGNVCLDDETLSDPYLIKCAIIGHTSWVGTDSFEVVSLTARPQVPENLDAWSDQE